MAVGITIGWLLVLASLSAVAGLSPLQRLAHTLEVLTNRTINLEHRGDRLEASLNQRQSSLDHASHTMMVNSQTLTNMTMDLTNRGKQMDTLNTYLQTTFSDMKIHVDNAEQPVAFIVHLRNDTVGEATPQQTPVLFDVLQYNTGGGNYSNSTGQYTAPSDGTYAFFFSIQLVDPSFNQCLEVVLYKNSRVWTGCAASACPPGYSAASNMCMMSMRKGDTMHARTWKSQQIFGFVHTTFSGFKLN